MSILPPYTKGDITTVQTGLKSVLKDPQTNMPILNDAVIRSDEIVTRTMQFIRLFILYKRSKNQMDSLQEFNKNYVLYFIRACGIKSNVGANAKNVALEDELDEFYDNEFSAAINNKEKLDLKNMSFKKKLTKWWS